MFRRSIQVCRVLISVLQRRCSVQCVPVCGENSSGNTARLHTCFLARSHSAHNCSGLRQSESPKYPRQSRVLQHYSGDTIPVVAPRTQRPAAYSERRLNCFFLVAQETTTGSGTADEKRLVRVWQDLLSQFRVGHSLRPRNVRWPGSLKKVRRSCPQTAFSLTTLDSGGHFASGRPQLG